MVLTWINQVRAISMPVLTLGVLHLSAAAAHTALVTKSAKGEDFFEWPAHADRSACA
jgi:hypothetical protein